MENIAAKVPDVSMVKSAMPGGGEKIMIVDDNVNIVSVMGCMLTHLGYLVYCAYDGNDAIALYKKVQDACIIKEREKGIELVILDVFMDSMSGIAAAKQLSQINPHIKVILSSGINLDDNKDILDELIGVSLCGCLSKPYNMKTLASAVRNALDYGCCNPDVGA
ncbi:MAG TPA: response regulator [Syntrophales bacterium]|nr:response regulator [Syntrophales bacterium]